MMGDIRHQLGEMLHGLRRKSSIKVNTRTGFILINPDEVVSKYGADTVRGHLMFSWRWYLGGPWDSQSIEGISRFLDRVWHCVLAEPTKGAKGKPSQEDISSLS